MESPPFGDVPSTLVAIAKKFAALSMALLAERAGVSPATPHNLLRRIVSADIARLIRNLDGLFGVAFTAVALHGEAMVRDIAASQAAIDALPTSRMRKAPDIDRMAMDAPRGLEPR